MLVPHHSIFTSLMPFLPPYQQCQSTDGKLYTSVYMMFGCI